MFQLCSDSLVLSMGCLDDPNHPPAFKQAFISGAEFGSSVCFLCCLASFAQSLDSDTMQARVQLLLLLFFFPFFSHLGLLN